MPAGERYPPKQEAADHERLPMGISVFALSCGGRIGVRDSHRRSERRVQGRCTA